MADPKGTSILRKLHAVMSEIPYIQKDAKNPAHNYRYASERVIKEALHALLVKHGVLLSISIANTRTEVLRATNRDGIETMQTIFLVDVQYEFVDVETGERETGTFMGSGAGRDEKGLYAGLTGAIKYILTSRFLIATGDDPEADEERKVEEPQRASAGKGPSRETQAKARATREAEAPAAPAPKPEVPASGLEYWSGTVVRVDERRGKKKDGTDWTLYVVEGHDGSRFGTFSKSTAEFAKASMAGKKGAAKVEIVWHPTTKGGREIDKIDLFGF